MIKEKRTKIIKIGITSLLGLLDIYVLYGVIMNLVVWFRQPRFLVDGGTSASLGFFIQFIIYTAIFVVVTAAGLITAYFFFRKKKAKATADTPQDIVEEQEATLDDAN